MEQARISNQKKLNFDPSDDFILFSSVSKAGMDQAWDAILENCEERKWQKQFIQTKLQRLSGPYVQGKIVGNLLFASGQVPLSPETGEIVGETIQEQTEQVLKNIGAILAEAGTDFDHVVKTTCFLSDMNDFVL